MTYTELLWSNWLRVSGLIGLVPCRVEFHPRAFVSPSHFIHRLQPTGRSSVSVACHRAIAMTINHQDRRDSRGSQSAFTITEVLVAVTVVAMVVVSLYTAFAAGFANVKWAREDLRATQIMLKRLETVRLYTWTQIQNNTYFPTNSYTEYYDPAGLTNGSGGGVPYAVAISRT